MATYSDELKSSAKKLYLKDWGIGEIAKELSVPERTIYDWREKGNWDHSCPTSTVEEALARRICRLSERENKTKTEIEELDKLTGRFGKLSIDLANSFKINATTDAIKNGTYEAPANRARNKKGAKKTVKNDISGITKEMLEEVRARKFGWDYLKLWHDNLHQPIRFILKSRQIGATYYFAWEALEQAILHGKNGNEIFLSASRNQAEVFRAYIISFAKEEFKIELKGTEFILLSNGAELRFLSTNATTANSYTGNTYKDEVFTMPNFDKLDKMSSGMSSQKRWRETYFSIPTAKSHPAYKLWNGDKYNSNLPKIKREKFDVSVKGLKNGVLQGGIWRHSITVEDAEKQGCDLFDISQLKSRYSKDDYKSLFMCEFIEDGDSVFSLNDLLKCTVNASNDAVIVKDNGDFTWSDYNEDSSRPFANKPVTVGFDPSLSGDGASLVVLDIPQSTEKPFRLLSHKTYYSKNFQFQANRIKDICDTHHVNFVGLDKTGGTGLAVFNYVENFYPMVTTWHYTPDIKARLVAKMQDLVANQRFKYFSKDTDITRAFLMITKTLTASGNQITYSASRKTQDGRTDHADTFWAISHACQVEPIAPESFSTVTFSD